MPVQVKEKTITQTPVKEEEKKIECTAVAPAHLKPRPFIPAERPSWAMTPEEHKACQSRTAVYRCPHCGAEHEEIRQNPADLPYVVECGCACEVQTGEGQLVVDRSNADVFRLPILETCTAVAFRRYSFPGEQVAVNARRFEPLVIYQSLKDPGKFSFPGRNYEPTDSGYKRIEITNIQEANYWTRKINTIETERMRDHREMHKYYFGARRKALRDHVNARSSRLFDAAMWNRLIRARSDRKTDARYGKPLDAHFHMQLIEFNQSNMQDWCDADTGWKSRRAR